MRELVQQAANGDKKALRMLLFQNEQLIESVINRFLWDRSVWEDVMQNICIKVMRAIGRFSGTCCFSTWVFRIAVNECIDANRKFSRLRSYTRDTKKNMDLFPDINAEDGLTAAIRSDIIEKVHRTISDLPDGMREAVELFYQRQCTGAEAARLLNISEQAFFMRLKAARDRLKKIFRN